VAEVNAIFLVAMVAMGNVTMFMFMNPEEIAATIEGPYLEMWKEALERARSPQDRLDRSGGPATSTSSPARAISTRLAAGTRA
jgi:hypothetical protein